MAQLKYNLENLGREAFNCRVKTRRSTCYYLNGGMSYRGHSKKLFAHRVAFPFVSRLLSAVS